MVICCMMIPNTQCAGNGKKKWNLKKVRTDEILTWYIMTTVIDITGNCRRQGRQDNIMRGLIYNQEHDT